MRKHELVHTKPFECDQCDFAFTTLYGIESGATPEVVSVHGGNAGDIAEGDVINFEIHMDIAAYDVNFDNSQIKFVPADGLPLNTDDVSSFFCELPSIDETPGVIHGFNRTCEVGKLPASQYRFMFTHSMTGNGLSDDFFYSDYHLYR